MVEVVAPDPLEEWEEPTASDNREHDSLDDLEVYVQDEQEPNEGTAGVNDTSIDSGELLSTQGSNEATNVTAYSYTIRPMAGAICNVIYVQTKNPDPTSFRFVDYNNTYATDHAYFELLARNFADVVYEDAATYRVKGGYLFVNTKYASDGGSLMLQAKKNDGYVDTGKTVACPALVDRVDYLINTYASEATGFFEKMDAVQDALNYIAVYPYSVLDPTRPREDKPYPFLNASGHSDVNYLCSHFDNYYAYEPGVLLNYVHPFMLDSLFFPLLLQNVATRLEPSASIAAGKNHWLIDVTYGGKTRSYVGQGRKSVDVRHGTLPLMVNLVQKNFRFDNSDDDYAAPATTIMDLTNLRLKYEVIAYQDDENRWAILSRGAIAQAVGTGSWIRIANGFSYEYESYSGTMREPSGTWVDGHYLDANCNVAYGERFANHPTANILLHNVRYMDMNRKEHCLDMLFKYNAEHDRWEANLYYTDGKTFTWAYDLPDDFVLTHEQVNELNRNGLLDGSTNEPIVAGCIYDGTAAPGTPFITVRVSSVALNRNSVRICKGGYYALEATIAPKDAWYTKVTWSSSNPSVASVENDGYVAAKAVGEATITATSFDGGKQATCHSRIARSAQNKRPRSELPSWPL